MAKLSAVARVTVSRVLNDGPNVSARTREKVLKAVAELGYEVNVQARALAGGGRRSILLICSSDVEQEPNSFYTSALEIGALRACAQKGYDLVRHSVVQGTPHPVAVIIQLVEGSGASGVILTPPFSDDVPLINGLHQMNRAVVSISPGHEAALSTTGVSMDDEAAGFVLMSHLLNLGHRQFGFIKGPADHLSAERRYSGAIRALKAAGFGEDAVVARRGNFTFRSGTEMLPEILAHDPQPTAVICANDDMAVGVSFAVHQMGLSVPGDISVTGFDDTPVSALVWPPLTTIHQPIQEMAFRAVELVAEQSTRSEEAEHHLEYLPFALVERASTSIRGESVPRPLAR